jgi:hypothetical protein
VRVFLKNVIKRGKREEVKQINHMFVPEFLNPCYERLRKYLFADGLVIFILFESFKVLGRCRLASSRELLLF